MKTSRPTPSSADYPALAVTMRASLTFSAVVAASLAHTGRTITAPQLRALVLVAARPNVGTAEVAEALDVEPSGATRLCDRLVSSGLVNRRRSAWDRRRVELELTDAGAILVDTVMEYRRRALDAVLQGMSAPAREALAVGLTEFADVAREQGTLSVVAPW